MWVLNFFILFASISSLNKNLKSNQAAILVLVNSNICQTRARKHKIMPFTTFFDQGHNNNELVMLQKAKQLYLNLSRWKYNKVSWTMSPLIARDGETKCLVGQGAKQDAGGRGRDSMISFFPHRNRHQVISHHSSQLSLNPNTFSHNNTCVNPRKQSTCLF